MSLKHIEIIITGKSGVILLNRPEVHNALNPGMIAELISAVKILLDNPVLRIMVIRGKNGMFSSGADLRWLKESGSKSFEQNLADSRILSELMETLHQVPVPLISVAEGLVYGGALGILGCSDWVLTEKNTLFAFSEVKLGLAPAIIMPYVLHRSNSLKVKQLMLSGRQFDAWDALDAGLVDHIGEAPDIGNELEQLVRKFSNLPGQAVREIKKLWSLSKPSVGHDIAEISIRSLAELKQSTEAQSLLTEFFNKK